MTKMHIKGGNQNPNVSDGFASCIYSMSLCSLLRTIKNATARQNAKPEYTKFSVDIAVDGFVNILQHSKCSA
jgi:hypothetical protein